MHIRVVPSHSSPHEEPTGRQKAIELRLAQHSQVKSLDGSLDLLYPSPPMSEPLPSPARQPKQADDPSKQPTLPAESTRFVERARDVASAQAESSTSPTVPPSLALEFHAGVEVGQLPQSFQRPQTREPASLRGSQYSRPFTASDQRGPQGFHGGQDISVPGQPTGLAESPELRPNRSARRAKAHVPSACVNCKRAHLSCDVQRPCTRCVTSGKQDSCYDVQHKKRGRPRLRERAETRGLETADNPPQIDQPGGLRASSASASPHPSQPDSLRFLRSRGASRGAFGHYEESYTPMRAGTVRGRVTSHPYQPSENYPGPLSAPVAFLDLDLTVLKASSSFEDLVAGGEPVADRNVADLIDARHTETLQRLRVELREEKESRDPAYMPPIFGFGEKGAVDAVTDRDLDRVSMGYSDREDQWTFLGQNVPPKSFTVSVRLAKTTMFFASLIIIPAGQTVRPATAYTSRSIAARPEESSPQLSSRRLSGNISHYSRAGTHPGTQPRSDSSSPYFVSPVLTSTLLPTSLSQASPYAHQRIPSADRGHTAAYQAPPPPPAPRPIFSPTLPSLNRDFEQPGSSHPGSLGDPPPADPRTRYRLPPLRSEAPAASAASGSTSTWTPGHQPEGSGASGEVARLDPVRSEVESARRRQRTPSQPPESAAVETPDPDDRRKRRRLNLGIHDVIE